MFVEYVSYRLFLSISTALSLRKERFFKPVFDYSYWCSTPLAGVPKGVLKKQIVPNCCRQYFRTVNRSGRVIFQEYYHVASNIHYSLLFTINIKQL